MTENKNKLIAWVEAARPRTLSASISPVLLGTALAWRDGQFRWLPALLCLLVGLLAQIASNFANDYFDFKKGADTDERLGPSRAVASGWITPRGMLTGTFITLGLACACGLVLVWFSGWHLLLVGIAVAIGVLAYSAGPYPLAYNGLGDVCVLVFYGIIPVVYTYYVQAHSFSTLSLLLATGLGFLSINILVVNNYRDYEQDKSVGKRTTIVLFGKTFGRYFYLLNGFIALAATIPVILSNVWVGVVLMSGFTILFLQTWKSLIRKKGRLLNESLGFTARNVLIYTVIVIVLLLT